MCERDTWEKLTKLWCSILVMANVVCVYRQIVVSVCLKNVLNFVGCLYASESSLYCLLVKKA